METFQKEISFLSLQFDASIQTHKQQLITRTATFKELNRTDRDQHALHFSIIEFYTSGKKISDKKSDEGKVKYKLSDVYPLTVECIDTLLLVNENFTSTDKTEFLNDSKAIFDFGMWLLKEKLSLFFNELI